MATSTSTAFNPMADGTSGRPMLEPTTESFIDALTAAGGPPLYTLSPEAARDVLAGAQAQPVVKSNAMIEDTTFPVGPTRLVGILIIRPPEAGGVLPVVMHFHGGGWILGDKDTHDRMAREIAVGANAAVVFVDYDRSLDAQYPTATCVLPLSGEAASRKVGTFKTNDAGSPATRAIPWLSTSYP